MSAQSLQKHLNGRSVFAFGIAGMIASGIFLLPGLVYGKVGDAAHWVYLAAGVLIIPTLLSKAELATAMPRSGGAYYVLDRSLGPAVGTIAGIGTWLSLIFKSSFDLIGLGAYILLFLAFPIKPVAIGLCIGFGLLSIFGTKHVGRLQIAMVALLLGGLAFFLATGVLNLDHGVITTEASWNLTAFMEAIGLVYVSFASLTKILSMAEEVDDLERNIPLGMFAAVGVTMLVYILGMLILMALIPAQLAEGTLTPMADAAGLLFGEVGIILFSVMAFLAFSASANAGLAAASRYPFALSRDKLLPERFSKLGKYHTPTAAIALTVVFMIFFVLILSPEGVAKLASTFLLVIFGFLNLAVIVMRESRIWSYDPGFKSPGYPWVQIVGLGTSVLLIPYLGLVPRLAAGGLVALGLVWYFLYGGEKEDRSSALVHVISKYGKYADHDIDIYLRTSLRERGLKSEDSLDDIMYRAPVVEHNPAEAYYEVVKRAVEPIAERLQISVEEVLDALRTSDEQGKTPASHHLALPHAYIPGIQAHEIAIIKSGSGFMFGTGADPIYAVFVLLSPEHTPKQHLRLLAEIANRAEGIDFEKEWRSWSTAEIRQHFVHSEAVREVHIDHHYLHGQPVRQLWMHPDCLIAFIERNGMMVIPHGDTRIEVNDWLVLIGSETGVRETAEWLEQPEFEFIPQPPKAAV